MSVTPVSQCFILELQACASSSSREAISANVLQAIIAVQRAFQFPASFFARSRRQAGCVGRHFLRLGSAKISGPALSPAARSGPYSMNHRKSSARQASSIHWSSDSLICLRKFLSFAMWRSIVSWCCCRVPSKRNVSKAPWVSMLAIIPNAGQETNGATTL